MDASVISSFERLEKLEKLWQPEKPVYQQESLPALLNLAALSKRGESHGG